MSLDDRNVLEMYRQMVTIRVFIRRAAEESKLGNIPAPMQAHEGEEASAVGICAALRQQDRITSTHRSLGHSIAKGMDIRGMMAELYGRSNGICRGKGGAMHLADFKLGMMGANGIVGGGLPIATGAALAAQMDGGDDVAVAFFGDGASNEGTFHSCINLASIWKLPVIYVCENNGWAIAVPASYALSVEDVSVRAVSYGIPGITVDGTDVLAVRETMEQAVKRARTGGGPTLLECKTYRKYVDDESTDRESASSPNPSLNDPILTLRYKILEQGLASSSDLADIDREVLSSVEDAVDFAKAGDVPLPEDALTQVFAS
tara:strand:- start:403 stop:1356 length:954 start_codon:yes stop_codon:yes gene_type:complete